MFGNKIVYVGVLESQHVSDWYRIKGFEDAGIDVASIDFRSVNRQKVPNLIVENILHFCYSLGTNYVFVNKGECITEQALLELRSKMPDIKLGLFYGDMRSSVEPYLWDILKMYDVVMVNCSDPNYVSALKERGAKRVEYLHTATDVDMFRKIDNSPEVFDVGFFGSNYNTFP